MTWNAAIHCTRGEPGAVMVSPPCTLVYIDLGGVVAACTALSLDIAGGGTQALRRARGSRVAQSLQFGAAFLAEGT
jgi:hypothetical protein